MWHCCEEDTDVEPKADVVGDSDVDIDCDIDVDLECDIAVEADTEIDAEADVDCDIDIEADAELKIEGDTDENAEATTDSVSYEEFRKLYTYDVYLYICFQLNTCTKFPKTSYARKESLYMMSKCTIWHLKS